MKKWYTVVNGVQLNVLDCSESDEQYFVIL